jgi:transcriptional regulator with XRE-family HTH domain
MEKHISPKQVGHRLKLLRGKLGQKEFVKKIGIPLRTYQRYEHGDQLPPFDILYQISVNCDVSVDWIVKGKGKKDLGKGELSVAIDNLHYIIMRGPFDLIDFIVEILNLAVSRFRLDIEEEDKGPDEAQREFVAFITEVLKIIPKTLLKRYEDTAKEKSLIEEIESGSWDNPTKN